MSISTSPEIDEKNSFSLSSSGNPIMLSIIFPLKTRNIVGILQTMNVLPRDHKSIGLVRFHDNNSYLANAGLINLYLISGATYDPKINFNTPVRNFDQHPNGGLPIIL